MQYALLLRPGAVSVVVQDTGIGIEGDKLHYIFDRFYQEATSHIPVVMLTARANEEYRIEGFDLGAMIT